MQSIVRKAVRPFTVALKGIILTLIICATGGAWAATDKTNPVTGENQSYTYNYVGIGAWTASDWSPTPSNVPQASGSGVWDPLLIDGNLTVTAPSHVEGWSFRIGLFGGAKLTVPYIRYWNGTAYAVVDTGSKLTIQSIKTSDNWNATVNYYVAAAGGITYKCAFNPTVTANAIYNYNLKGAGSVVYEWAVSSGSHVIKMADATLSGTSRVASKTLVSFASTTKTFTADAVIKVYDTDGTTLKKLVGVTAVRQSGATIANTSSVLTIADAVGTCEIVQCTDGIVLYYVDGAPSAVYTPSININFCFGNAPLTTTADVGHADYAVPGTSWNNMTSTSPASGNGTFTTPLTTVYAVKTDGTTSLVSGASVALSGTPGSYKCNTLAAATDLRHGYIDENANNTAPTVTVSGIPYDKYKVVVYTSTDTANSAFGYVSVNDTNYTYDNNELANGTTAWGASGADHSAKAIAEGVNMLVTPTISGATATIVGHRSNGRGCIAAVQIVAEIGENDLLIELDGDETHTFNEAKTYDTVYVTGSGTLTFAGTASTAKKLYISGSAAVNMNGSSLTPTVVTGTGTFRYTSGYPTTIPSAEYSYEYVGGATEATKVTVSDVLTINGNLKTSGYIALTGANTLAAGGSLEVLSDKTELAAVQGVKANGWSGGLGGTITIDANAELANLTTDALTRSGSLVNINVYGTLNFGTTRWTMQSSQYHRLNLHGNAEVKGSGDGNGILDFETANSSYANINVNDGTPTISGPLKFRANTITWIASNAKLAVTGGTIDNGEFAKSGAGTLRFSAVAPSTTGGLSASEGTIELDNISYTAGTITISSSSESPTLKMIATDAATTVSATVNVPANTRGQLAFEGAGTFALSGPNRNDNIVWLGTNPVPGTLQLNGNVTINNGSVNTDYRFNKLGSGSSTLSLATWSGCYDKNDNPGLGYTFDTIDADAFTGTIALSNSATDSNGGCTMNFSAVNIIKSSAVYGTPLVKVTKAVGARTDSFSNAINVSATKFNGKAATFIYDDSEAGKEGIYLAAATYDGQNYKTIQDAIDAAGDENLANIVVADSSAAVPEGYALVGGTRLRKGGETIYWTSGTYWAASGGSAVFSTALSDGEVTTYAAGDTVVIPDTTKRWYGQISDGAKIVFSCGGTIDVDKTGDLGYAFKNAGITIESGTTVNFVQDGYGTDPEVNGGSISGEGAITVADGATLALSGEVELGITPSGGTVNVASGAEVSCTGSATISSTLAGMGEISFETLPSSALTLGAWTGTVELPVLTADRAYQLNNYGKANSTIRLNGLSAGWLAVAEPITVNANLELAGDWNLAAMSTRVYNFATVSGTGNMSFATTQYQPTSINIATLSGYSGAITNNTDKTLSIGTLALGSGASVAPGAKLLSTGGTGAFSVTAVTVGGEAQTLTLSYRSDGVYVRGVASYGNVEYETIQEAINAAEQAGDTYSDVTILDPNATCPDGYYVDTDNSNALTKCQAAVVKTDSSKVYFKTPQLAFDDISATDNLVTYMSGYTCVEVYYGKDTEILINASASIWIYGKDVKIRCLNGSTVSVTTTATESTLTAGTADENGIVTYSSTPVATTYVWAGTAGTEANWSSPAKWKVGSAEGAPASRAPGSTDTVVFSDGARVSGVSGISVAAMQVRGAVTISGGGTLTSASAITLGANDSIVITGTLSPTPTTNVSHSRVKAVPVGSTTTYSVEEIPGTIFSVY